VARSFARIFLQNCINLGLRVVPCPTVEAGEGDELEITAVEVINKNYDRHFPVLALPKSRLAILDAGGLIEYTRSRLIQGAVS
jgi:3-isopropylmalate dehydratase small subunit